MRWQSPIRRRGDGPYDKALKPGLDIFLREVLGFSEIIYKFARYFDISLTQIDLLIINEAQKYFAHIVDSLDIKATCQCC